MGAAYKLYSAVAVSSGRGSRESYKVSPAPTTNKCDIPGIVKTMIIRSRKSFKYLSINSSQLPPGEYEAVSNREDFSARKSSWCCRYTHISRPDIRGIQIITNTSAALKLTQRLHARNVRHQNSSTRTAVVHSLVLQ